MPSKECGRGGEKLLTIPGSSCRSPPPLFPKHPARLPALGSKGDPSRVARYFLTPCLATPSRRTFAFAKSTWRHWIWGAKGTGCKAVVGGAMRAGGGPSCLRLSLTLVRKQEAVMPLGQGKKTQERGSGVEKQKTKNEKQNRGEDTEGKKSISLFPHFLSRNLVGVGSLLKQAEFLDDVSSCRLTENVPPMSHAREGASKKGLT